MFVFGGNDDCYLMGLYVLDVDVVVEKVVVVGVIVCEVLVLFVLGDCFVSICDLFGVRWLIMIRVEDIFEEESSCWVVEWVVLFSVVFVDDVS